MTMTIKKIFFLALLTIGIGTGLISAQPAGATMVKEIAMGVFTNAPSQAELDRYYLGHHGPEVVQFSGAWLRKYQLWLPYDPPKEAVERFNAVKGRYAELWFGSEEEYLDRPAHGPMSKATFKSVGENKQTVVMVPAKPTEEFYDPDPNANETPIFRWVQIIRYPDGVSVEEGEKWFLNVHAKEALNQPGLMKFVSYRILTEAGEKMNQLMSKYMSIPPLNTGAGTGAAGGSAPSGGGPSMGNMPKIKTWVRVNEYWYKDVDAWRKAVLESPPKYTAPSWGGTYPFVDMISTFIPYMHDVDFLKGGYIVP
jgi:hypothetical protein